MLLPVDKFLGEVIELQAVISLTEGYLYFAISTR